MIDGVNDHDWQADLIAKKLRGMPGHVNLIPLNDVVESPYKPSRRIGGLSEAAGDPTASPPPCGGAWAEISTPPADSSAGRPWKKRRKGSDPNDRMNVWGMTDIGLVRKENQDAYRSRRSTRTPATRSAWCATAWAAPPAAGWPARSPSRDFLEELERLLTAGSWTPQQLLEASAQAVAAGQPGHPAEASSAAEECRNMGTTLVSAVSYDGGAVVTNVGDSRAYHITRGGHHPDHQGPLPGGEHGGPGRYHR